MGEPIKYICDILKHELSLTNDQIWIYNQKRDIPSDFNTYIVVEYVGQKVIGNSRREIATEQGLTEYQSVHSLANISVNLFSRDPLVRNTKDLVLMALNSTFAQQIQEKYSFQIARNSFQVTNTSEIEGVAELNRYTISFNVTYMSETSKSIDYFDTFTKEVITEA